MATQKAKEVTQEQRVKEAKTKALPKGQYVQKGKIVNAWGKALDVAGNPVKE